MNEYSEPCDEEASSGDRCSVDEEADLPPVLYGLEVQRVCCNRKRGLALGVGMSRFKSKEGMDSRADNAQWLPSLNARSRVLPAASVQ